MKNWNHWQVVDEARKNGGCGRVMFQRTATGEPRVCGITGKCDLCRKESAAAVR